MRSIKAHAQPEAKLKAIWPPIRTESHSAQACLDSRQFSGRAYPQALAYRLMKENFRSVPGVAYAR